MTFTLTLHTKKVAVLLRSVQSRTPLLSLCQFTGSSWRLRTCWDQEALTFSLFFLIFHVCFSLALLAVSFGLVVNEAFFLSRISTHGGETDVHKKVKDSIQEKKKQDETWTLHKTKYPPLRSFPSSVLFFSSKNTLPYATLSLGRCGELWLAFSPSQYCTRDQSMGAWMLRLWSDGPGALASTRASRFRQLRWLAY